MNKKLRKRLTKLHDILMDENISMSFTSDTGMNIDGWIVYTVSCKKENLLKKLEHLKKTHNESYPIT